MGHNNMRTYDCSDQQHSLTHLASRALIAAILSASALLLCVCERERKRVYMREREFVFVSVHVR